MSKWFKLICPKKDLQLEGTLNGGQSFRWKKNADNDWIGIFNAKVWVLRQKEECIEFQVFEQSLKEPPQKRLKVDNNAKYGEMLRRYFNLDVNIQEHFVKWSEVDPNFKEAAQKFYGIRILRQEPIENIFSFICSSNNHISRISSMVEKLATFYGEEICKIGKETYYAFPNAKELAADEVEKKLRLNGFGYRSKYINQSAKLIESKGDNWLKDLCNMSYKDAKSELTQLTGIGAKVADCICLMSLNHLEAIPVDTHVYQIAARNYMPNLKKQKTVTEKVYSEIVEHFQNLYGPLAGWAHTVLFCADLKQFKDPAKKTKK